MMKNFTLHFKSALLLLSVLAVNISAIAQCLTNQLNINTGHDPATNGVYATGTQDQYWSVTFNSTGNQAFAASTPPYQAYVNVPNAAYATNAGSQWISFLSNPNYSPTSASNDSTYYNTYTRHFKNCLADTFTFSLQYGADNWLGDLYVDGVLYFSQPGPASPNPSQFNVFNTITPFTVYLTPGTHTIDAVVFNFPSGGLNPTGFNMLGTITGTQSSLLTDTCTLSTGLTITPPADTICAGGSVSLTAAGALTYSWSPSTGLNTTSGATVIATPTATSAYYVSGNICLGTTTDSVIIHVIPYASVNAGPDTGTCIHHDIQLKAITNINLGTTVAWAPATYLSATNILNPVVQNPLSSVSYIVTVSNHYGNLVCASSDTVAVNVVPYLSLNAGHDTSVCIHNKLQLSASVSGNSGPYSIRWSPGGFLNDSTIANPVMQDPSGTVTYYLSVMPVADVNCPAYDTITISVLPVPQVQLADTSVCNGTSIWVTAENDPSFSYSWSPTKGVSNAAIINPLIDPDTTTTYILTGTNNKGCVFHDTMSVTVFLNPVITAEADANTLTCKKQSVQLSASGASRYVWSPGKFCDDSTAARTNVSNFAFPTLFTLTGTDNNGCSGTATIKIDNNTTPLVFIPNAFTPNDDGLNDIVFLKIYCDFIMDRFEIYDRWGQRVFKAVNEQQGWDGKAHGQPADIGTYFYLVEGHSEQGKNVSLKGDITLIR